ncbi:MAG: DUF3124 domain-containing protein [Gemmatimonadetes bacterium]|nr:DUF3124 domain-containing protein [Gemmatimonadota bacterium]
MRYSPKVHVRRNLVRNSRRAISAAGDPVTVSGSVYVPVYSHIYYRDEHGFVNLAVTLSL